MSDELQQPPNSALDVKLDYLQRDVREIKSDIKEIKNDYVARREFNETIKDVRESIKPLKQFVYGIITIMGVAIIGALLNLILKRPQ